MEKYYFEDAVFRSGGRGYYNEPLIKVMFAVRVLVLYVQESVYSKVVQKLKKIGAS